MKKLIFKFLAVIYMLNIITPVNLVYAEDDPKRQNVLQRTFEYSKGVDLTEINQQMRKNFTRDLERNSGDVKIDNMASKCEGYTKSKCGKPCCGKDECERICKANMSISHGNEMCLSQYTKSDCGMSCCGKEDCENVCLNYRITQGKCGNFTKTLDGEPCCGLDDCRAKQCGKYTSVTNADGKVVKCCGKKNCQEVKCQYIQETTGKFGGSAGKKCCGQKDCYLKECDGMISVNSKIDPNKKNIKCCGKIDCHDKECDGYTQIQTPKGTIKCCGYEDCHNKECEGYTTVTSVTGKKYACCGRRDCYAKSCDEYLLTVDGVVACCGYEECRDKNIKLCENTNYVCYRLGGPHSDGGERAEYSDDMSTITFYSMGLRTHVQVFGFGIEEVYNFELEEYIPAYGGTKLAENIICPRARLHAYGSGETGIPQGIISYGLYEPYLCGMVTSENNGVYKLIAYTSIGARRFTLILRLK